MSSKPPVQIFRNGLAPVGGGNDKDFRPKPTPVESPPEFATDDAELLDGEIPSYDLTPSPDLSDSSPDPQVHPSQTPDPQTEITAPAAVVEPLSPQSLSEKPPQQNF